MTDIAPEYYGDEDEKEEEEELFYEIYVEIATDTIHEVQFFDNFCLVRPALQNTIRKFSISDFSRDFKEYGGDASAIRDYIRKGDTDLLVE